MDEGEKVAVNLDLSHSVEVTPRIPYGDVGTSLPVQMSAHIL